MYKKMIRESREAIDRTNKILNKLKRRYTKMNKPTIILNEAQTKRLEALSIIFPESTLDENIDRLLKTEV